MPPVPDLTPVNDGFPDPRQAMDEPNGLLAVGGDLSPARLISAYRQGIFPWFNEGDPIIWWAPTPRAVFFPDKVKPSRSLIKLAKKYPWRVSVNQAFDQVISHCAAPRANEPDTWINSQMIEAYQSLHRIGKAHSVEIWLNEKLVGGLYGVCVGKVFCGESMFHTVSGASKLAFWQASRLFSHCGIELIDAQLENSHLMSLGAELMDREAFLESLEQWRDDELNPQIWQARWLEFQESPYN
ncbi:leucyl/phenylalanyl-tRNA--protein transferase [Paraferrimonas haliotis]|uniref:Leucyl/phenylalanyl-tRNA--protein transferase n=1 Tax=Paraferrimonas haliotis TaxID=2013866 RepID=A0AA37TSI1_9GAMM|nr:leucyl/phenylalanyl-tRNA--protein transferase [Paraferrimonas haliotis]GLS84660.1 leucyl/phenylalanyl-tRNA--protein transferase [Paraferrimonas haliotis]